MKNQALFSLLGFTWKIKPYFLWKTMKKYLWMSSAAVVIGALKVNYEKPYSSRTRQLQSSYGVQHNSHSTYLPVFRYPLCYKKNFDFRWCFMKLLDKFLGTISVPVSLKLMSRSSKHYVLGDLEWGSNRRQNLIVLIHEWFKRHHAYKK